MPKTRSALASWKHYVYPDGFMRPDIVSSSQKLRRYVLAVFLVVGLLGTAACSGANAPEPTNSTNTPAPKIFRFGTPTEPLGLDPALSNDTDTFRITRQIFEGLVTTSPTTGKPSPALATEWEVKNNDTLYEFTLRENVLFHDGQPFNAAAVCTNFNRWYNYPAQSDTQSFPTVFRNVFRAFSNAPEQSLYKGCTVQGEQKVALELRSPLTGFLDTLTSPAFAIASPAALSQSGADTPDQDFENRKYSKFALTPVGTGPFKFSSWEPSTVTLNRNPQYWGDSGELDGIQFTSYTQPYNRVKALLQGEIDGYDGVTLGSVDTLVRNGYQIPPRDPFSVLYLGLNQNIPALKDEKVRQAINLTIDRDSLVRSYLLNGSSKAGQFMPVKLGKFNNQVSPPSLDRNRAKALLAESTYKYEPLPFYYPLNTTRTYMPAPERIYADIAAQLTSVGFNIKPVPIEWSQGYQEKISTPGDYAFFLSGTNGSYTDPDNFLGPLFGTANPKIGYDNPALIEKITKARALPDGNERIEAYQDINQRIADTLPAIPLAFPISSVVLSPKVSDYPLSPVLNEVFTTIKLNS